jgi:hypothetical protein
MQNKNKNPYMSGNALKHVAPVAPASVWPPAWLPTAEPTADENTVAEPAHLPEPPATIVAETNNTPVADDCIEIPIGSAWSCPKCGSYEAWQDLRDGWHCTRCEAGVFHRSMRLADKAAKIRGRQKINRTAGPCVSDHEAT